MHKFIYVLEFVIFVAGHIVSSQIAENTDFSFISDKKIEQLLTNSLNGLKKALVSGEKDLNIPVMDPFKIKDDVTWKYWNQLNTVNLTVLIHVTSWSGLSNYTIQSVKVNTKRLETLVNLTIGIMKIRGYYYGAGNIYKGVLPIFGRGNLNSTIEDTNITLSLKLSLNHSNIDIQKTSCSFNLKKYNVNAENLLGSQASPLANAILFDITNELLIRKKFLIQQNLNMIYYNTIKNAIGGLHISKLFAILEKLSKKLE